MSAQSKGYVTFAVSAPHEAVPLDACTVGVVINEIAHAAAGGAPEVAAVVAAAVRGFLDAGGVPQVAARKVSHIVRRLGVEVAMPGLGTEELAGGFERARAAALVVARHHLDAHLDHDPLREVLARISDYLCLLHEEAERGLAEMTRLRSLEASQQTEELRRALFHASEPIDVLALLTGHGATEPYVAVVAVQRTLPEALLHAEGVIVGSRWEVAVPSDVLLALRLPDILRGPIVTGPPVPLKLIPETIDLARRSVRLLQSGAARHPGPVIPCRDLVASLALAGTPLLNQLAAEKHLGPLQSVRSSQRADLAQLLNSWLEHGLPLSQVASTLNLPQQTAQRRFCRLRDLYGEHLDNPDSRLELLLALRHIAMSPQAV